MVVDKVNRNPQPLRGNQLAQALRVAGVVNPPDEAPPGRGGVREAQGRALFKPLEIDESKVLPELRAYLANLVAGERVTIGGMTPSLPTFKRSEISRRLKMRGLIEVKIGPQGGAYATQALIDLARRDISDDELRELTLQDPPEEEVVPEPVREIDMADTLAVLANVRAWLMSNVEHGAELRIAQMGLGTSGNAYNMANRMRVAGIIERVGEGSGSYHAVVDHERVREMTDEDLLALLWPHGRRTDSKKRPTDDGEDLDAQITPELAEQLYPQGPEATPETYEDPVVKVFGQILTVLTRMDARFARLERELGLGPIEQDGK